MERWTRITSVKDNPGHLEVRGVVDENFLDLDIIRRVVDTLSSISNPYHDGHEKRVSMLSIRIAEKLGLSEKLTHQIKWAAILHDIGKVIIPEEILNKKTRLNREDWRRIKAHPADGADVIDTLKFTDKTISLIVRYHHERWDGSGYPDMLHELTIPIGARIIAIADSLDAMTNERPYRPVYSISQALKIMDKEVGKKFDPEIYAVARMMVDA